MANLFCYENGAKQVEGGKIQWAKVIGGKRHRVRQNKIGCDHKHADFDDCKNMHMRNYRSKPKSKVGLKQKAKRGLATFTELAV